MESHTATCPVVQSLAHTWNNLLLELSSTSWGLGWMCLEVLCL